MEGLELLPQYAHIKCIKMKLQKSPQSSSMALKKENFFPPGKMTLK